MVYAENTLAFSQPASGVSHIFVSAESTLTFSQEVETTNPPLRASATDTLTFQQSVSVIRPVYLSVESTLGFTQSAYNSIKAESVESVLTFTQDVDVRQPIFVNATNYLVFGDSANPGQKVISRSVTSYLSFADYAAKTAQVLTASNHLHLSQEVDTRKFLEEPLQILYFSQVATCEKASPAYSTLSFGHLVDCFIVKVATLNHSLTFTQTASAFVADKSSWTGAPTLTRRDTTILTWPYAAPTLTVEVPAPEFDNQEAYNVRRVNRKSRGGTLDIYRDSNWPSVREFTFSFHYLTDEQRREILEFLNVSLGEEIGMLDFESRQWRGIILTPSSEIADAGPDKHGLGLAFEGELV